MITMDRIKEANKWRHDKYAKSKAHYVSILEARNAIAAKEKANVCKAQSRTKKRKTDQQKYVSNGIIW